MNDEQRHSELLASFQTALYRCFDEQIPLNEMEPKLIKYVTKSLKKNSWFKSIHLKYHDDPRHRMPHRFDIGVLTNGGDPLVLQFEIKILKSLPDAEEPNTTLH